MTKSSKSGLLASLKSQPWLTHLVFGTALVSHLFGGMLVTGYRLQGWMWVLILAGSVLVLAQRFDRVTFPWALWLPWMLWVLWNAFSGYEYAVQSTAQILCPLVAGIAVSAMTVGPESLARFEEYVRWVFYAFLLIFLVFVLPWTLRDVENSGFPAGAINALFFQAFFLCAWLLGHEKRKNLLMYLAAVAIPTIGANRGPMLASFGLVLATVAPLSLSKRLLIAVAGVGGGLILFYTPKVQHKMFFSGKGDIWDLRMENPDLNTSGRAEMWKAMERGIQKKPWLGHGGNADRTYLLSKGFATYLPHNDWLRIRFNYGNLGALLYAATMLTQMWLVHRRSRKASPAPRLIACAAASCFVPYMIVMYTDNVLIYCQYFTVPLFMMLGMAYATCRQERPVTDPYPKRRLRLRPVSVQRLPSASRVQFHEFQYKGDVVPQNGVSRSKG